MAGHSNSCSTGSHTISINNRRDVTAIMNKQNLKATLLKKGIESVHLDDLVHDAASLMASAANNDGVEGQVDFLIETCGWTPEMLSRGAVEVLLLPQGVYRPVRT